NDRRPRMGEECPVLPLEELREEAVRHRRLARGGTETVAPDHGRFGPILERLDGTRELDAGRHRRARVDHAEDVLHLFLRRLNLLGWYLVEAEPVDPAG